MAGKSLTYVLVCIIFLNTDVFSLDLTGPKNSESYGPYEIEVAHYEVCKGPKLHNSALATCDIRKNEKGDYLLLGNITFIENCELSQIKMKVLAIKGNKKSMLLKYSVSKPCQHFMIGSVIEQYLHAANCMIKKESYFYAINYSELVRSFFGSSFFYGQYELRSNTNSKKGNIICLNININFKKLDKKL